MNTLLLSQDDFDEDEFLKEASKRILKGDHNEILGRLKRKKYYGAPEEPNSYRRIGYFLLAAVVAFSIYSIVCHFYQANSTEKVSLLACVNKVDRPSKLFEADVDRGEKSPLSDQEQELLMLARREYQGENFSDAVVLYKELNQIDSLNSEYLICLAHAQSHLEKYGAAIKHFNKAIAASRERVEADNNNAAKVLLALVYLKTNRIEEGRELLKEEQGKGGVYEADIDKLLSAAMAAVDTLSLPDGTDTKE